MKIGSPIFFIVMFRYPVRQNWRYIAYGSVIMILCSYFIREIIGLVKISPVIQLLILIFITMALLRIRFLHSALMVSFAYLGFAVVQVFVLFATESITYFENVNALITTNYVIAMTIITSLVMLIICAILSTYRIGFTYEPERDSRIESRHKMILYGFLLWSAILLGASLSLIQFYSFQFVFIITVLTLYYLFDYVMKREIKMSEDRILNRGVQTWKD